MKEVTMLELKEIELEALAHIVHICQKNKLRYFLAGGTLLGAVRHKGFIPWDDDIDIFLPRKDYDKLMSIYRNNDKFRLLSYLNCNNYRYPFAKICCKRTYMKEVGCLDIPELGVYLDIFPVDKVPNNMFKKAIAWKGSKILKHMVGFSAQEKYEKSSIIWKNILRWPYFNLCKLVNYHRIFAMYGFWLKIINVTNSNNVANLVWGYGERETIPSNIIEDFIDVEFEGKLYKSPKDYDIYLTNVYGNYMEFPPVEQRISIHNFKAYWRD